MHLNQVGTGFLTLQNIRITGIRFQVKVYGIQNLIQLFIGHRGFNYFLITVFIRIHLENRFHTEGNCGIFQITEYSAGPYRGRAEDQYLMSGCGGIVAFLPVISRQIKQIIVKAAFGTVEETEHGLIWPGIRSVCHPEGDIGMEIASFIVTGIVISCLRRCIRQQNTANVQIFQQCFSTLCLHRSANKLQIIFFTDFFNFIHHFPGIGAIKCVFFRELLRIVFRFKINLVILVIALFKFVPLLSCLIVGSTLQAAESQGLLGDRLRYHGVLLIVPAVLRDLGFTQFQILHFQNIYHPAAHQQKHQDNQCSNQQRSVALSRCFRPARPAGKGVILGFVDQVFSHIF